MFDIGRVSTFWNPLRWSINKHLFFLYFQGLTKRLGTICICPSHIGSKCQDLLNNNQVIIKFKLFIWQVHYCSIHIARDAMDLSRCLCANLNKVSLQVVLDFIFYSVHILVTQSSTVINVAAIIRFGLQSEYREIITYARLSPNYSVTRHLSNMSTIWAKIVCMKQIRCTNNWIGYLCLDSKRTKKMDLRI